MRQKSVIQCLASHIVARLNSIKSNNADWIEIHSDRIEQIVKEFLPSGSGFDDGCKIDLAVSDADKIVIQTAFHHMKDGFYDGWTHHNVTIRPGFEAVKMSISGQDRNQIKDYIYQSFGFALDEMIEFNEMRDAYITAKAADKLRADWPPEKIEALANELRPEKIEQTS